MACNTILTYPDSNDTFKIHSADNVFQLGAVIIQKGKAITFYSRKFTDSQQWYKVTEKELLIIVETLNDFRAILLGKKLRFCTGNRKLTGNNFNTYIVLILILKRVEYSKYIEYIKGEKDAVAYALSRLPIYGNQETT